MRRVTAAFGICSLLVVLPVFAAAAAEPPSTKDDATVQKACLKLAADPFAGSGPREMVDAVPDHRPLPGHPCLKGGTAPPA